MSDKLYKFLSLGYQKTLVSIVPYLPMQKKVVSAYVCLYFQDRYLPEREIGMIIAHQKKKKMTAFLKNIVVAS